MRETAVTTERLRLARDLHDGVLQTLTGAALQLQTARRLMTLDPPAAEDRLSQVQRIIAAGQNDLRFFIQQLGPRRSTESSGPVDLNGRVGELADRVRRQWGVPVTVATEPEQLQVPDQLVNDVFLLIHEALVNAARHAKASSLQLALLREPQQLSIAVADDGQGFPFQGRFTLEDLARDQRGTAYAARAGHRAWRVDGARNRAGRQPRPPGRAAGWRGRVKRIRLVLADDHPIVLDGLEQLFSTESDLEVVARATSAEGAVRALEEFRPDVLVLDLAMPGHDGIWVMEQAAARKFPTRIVLLTAHVDEQNLLDAVRLNVAGVVLKEMAPRLLVECVRKVHAGEKWLEKHSVARAMDRMVKRENELQRLSRLLTPREMEIVRLAAEGLRNKEIADRLTITEGTVKIHLHNIYEKLGVTGRPQLILYATRQGII